MQIRIQNISESRGNRLKAIARVKYGQTSVPEFVKILLAEAEGKYTLKELIAIENLYRHIAAEDAECK